jgi:hypothetical protein
MKFDLRKFLAVVAQVGPVVLAAVPGGQKIGAIIPQVVDAIGEAEQIKGATGAEKKAHVLNVVRTAVNVANSSGRVKLDSAEVEAVASAGVDAVIGTVHVIDGAKVDKNAASGSASFGAGTATGAAGSVPGVDTAQRASDLGDGHATHGHGSNDHLPPAPSASGTDTDRKP